MSEQPIARGTVVFLGVNGKSVHDDEKYFDLLGPMGDTHSGHSRSLSGHDSVYIKTSNLKRGDKVFNWRSWSGLSMEEIGEIENTLGVPIPPGCLLENIRISGIRFADLSPTSRLVFPIRPRFGSFGPEDQVVLAVWEQNGPCATAGERLARVHKKPDLKTTFVRAAQGKRGVVGFVLSPGIIRMGDEVLVYPPVS